MEREDLIGIKKKEKMLHVRHSTFFVNVCTIYTTKTIGQHKQCKFNNINCYSNNDESILVTPPQWFESRMLVLNAVEVSLEEVKSSAKL
jgi:7,8-dihydro-6-hydroxymethylpterin-pyrophosphokinase